MGRHIHSASGPPGAAPGALVIPMFKEAVMRKSLLAAALTAVLLALPIAASAAGPYDGVYVVTLTPPSGPALTNFGVVTQNGSDFLLVRRHLDLRDRHRRGQRGQRHAVPPERTGVRDLPGHPRERDALRAVPGRRRHLRALRHPGLLRRAPGR